jgi:hypothetical protein
MGALSPSTMAIRPGSSQGYPSSSVSEPVYDTSLTVSEMAAAPVPLKSSGLQGANFSYCIQCGLQLSDQDTFCTGCGLSNQASKYNNSTEESYAKMSGSAATITTTFDEHDWEVLAPMLAGVKSNNQSNAAHQCNVLITGDSKAHIKSISQALQGCERPGQVQMQVAEQVLDAKKLLQLDKFLTLKLSQFNAIFIAVDASGIRLPITGAGGRATPLLEKFQIFGIHPLSIYFVATGDKTTEVMKADEYVSEDCLRRVGPMQLGALEDYISHARFLSWKTHPLPHQQALLREHMLQLAIKKPKQNVDTTNFRCAWCSKDIPMQDLRDMLAEGHDLSTGRHLCQDHSKGHCVNCGLQIGPGRDLSGRATWEGVTKCLSCSFPLIPDDLALVLNLPPPKVVRRNKYTSKPKIEWGGVTQRAYIPKGK